MFLWRNQKGVQALMEALSTKTLYGEFICESCRDEPGDSCTESCAMAWADELPQLGDEWWPPCKCCGTSAHLLAPLAPVS
jgi:hypothetical protein